MDKPRPDGSTKRQHIQKVKDLMGPSFVDDDEPSFPITLLFLYRLYWDIALYKADITEPFTINTIYYWSQVMDEAIHPILVRILKRMDIAFITSYTQEN